MRVWLVLALLSAAAHADEVDPDAPSLRLHAQHGGQVVLTPKVKVGEPFHVLVDATAKPDVLVNLPASWDAGSFEVVGRSELASADGTERRWDLTVVAWKPGKSTLPPIPITYVSKGKGEVKQIATASLDIEVTPVLEDPEKAELAANAAPVEVYVKDWTLAYVTGGVAGALLAGGAGVLIGRAVARRRRRARPVVRAVDLRPAHEIALGRLAELERSGALDQVDRRPFYFAVTEIVRDYLGRRFEIDALDMTSTELLDALGRSPAAPEAQRDVARWLGACDLVKFARVAAARDEAAGALAAARALVEASKPPPEAANA
jgi:hypothetical protein